MTTEHPPIIEHVVPLAGGHRLSYAARGVPDDVTVVFAPRPRNATLS